MEIHVVRPGETLYGIAVRYQADPAILQELNGLLPDSVLAVGQTLVIRHVDTFHTVQPGQTLAGIAGLYGVPLRQLYRNNFDLGGQPAIQPGQRLGIAYRDPPGQSIHTNGYAYPFVSRELLSAQLPYMSFLTPFTYGIDASGGLLPLDDGPLLEEARRLGTAPLMHLSTLTETDSFSSGRAVMVLTDPAMQEALIEQILATVSAKGYRGVDVDFEYIPGDQREAYADFIRRLRSRLAPAGLPVTVALAPPGAARAAVRGPRLRPSGRGGGFRAADDL